MFMHAHADLCCECKIDDALRSYVVQHIPCRFLGREAVLNIDMRNATTATLLIKERTEAAFLLNCALLHQWAPLIAVDEVFALFKEKVVCLAKNTSTVFSQSVTLLTSC